LRAFWTGLTDPEDWYTQNAALFVPGGDYAALDQAEWQARARAEVLTMDALGLLRSFMVPYRPGDARYVESIIVDIAGVGADKIADALGSAVETALEEAGQAVLSYVPIVAIVYAAAKFGIQELQSALRQQTADRLAATAAIFDDSGLRALITTATNGLQGRVQASGRRLRVSLTNLEKGRALYGTEGGGVSEAPIGSQIRAIANIATVVQTSATAPFLSAPRSLGGDSYVDGALRDPVPVGAVVEAGAGSVIIVQPHIRLIAELPSFATAGVPTIDARTSVVRDADSLDGRVNPFGNFANDSTGAPVGSWRVPTFLIEPTVDIVGLGATLGQAGLVDIMSDYGYMRAYDALVPWLLFPRPAQRADRDEMRSTLMTSGDHIVGLRVKAWGLEHDFNGMRPTPFGSTNRIGAGPLVADPDPSALDAIRTTKLDIRAAVVDRLGILARYEGRAPQVPAGTITAPPVPRPRAESWVQMWEKHDFFLVVAPVPPTPAEPDGDPWVSLGYGGLWTEPAAARPALIWP
jgi:hypothetical protein